MRTRHLGILAVLCIVSTARQTDAAVECQISEQLRNVPGLVEASGLAMSRTGGGRMWSHNDSGAPELFELDGNGHVVTRLRVEGATVLDWEAIATGPCAGASCIFIGDIGDNEASRNRITVYRAAEPETGERSVRAVAFHATYPDGAHDAEALFVAPDGRIYIVTKGETGASALYAFPSAVHAGQVHRLERIGSQRSAKAVGTADRITDASMSPDGKWVVLRTTASLIWYPATAALAGQWQQAERYDLQVLREPQGEGLALANDGTVYLAGEGGERSKSGTFARLQCRP